jgi:hypothetical protein
VIAGSIFGLILAVFCHRFPTLSDQKSLVHVAADEQGSE